jgi:putative transposase
MPQYRRARLHGGTYFFTVVTYRRRPIFSNATARKLLGDSFRECLDRGWR